MMVDGKAVEAAALVQKFVTAHPDFGEGHSMLASLHSVAAEALEEAGPAEAARRRRHLETAAVHYRRSLELTRAARPLDVLSLARVYGPGALNQPAETEKYARLTLDAYSGSVEAQSLLAWALAETERSDAAAASLQRARAATADVEDRLKLAIAVADLAKQPSASAAAARALLVEALAITDDAIKSAPGFGQAYMTKSIVIERQAAREQDAARRAALTAESKALWNKGREVIAAAAAQRGDAPATPPLPKVPDGWYDDAAKARDLAAAGKHAEPLAIYEKYVASHPDFADAHDLAAGTHQSMGDAIKATGAQPSATRRRHFETAVKHYRRAAELAAAGADMPRQYWALFELYGEDHLNRPADADALARDVVKRYPADAASHMMLVKIFATTRQTGLMASALDTARALVPTTPEARQKLGVYLYDLVYNDAKIPAEDGRTLLLEAIAAFDQALQARPDHREALVYKSLALRLQATKFEPDAARAKALVAEADRLRARAMELLKRKRDALRPLSPPR